VGNESPTAQAKYLKKKGSPCHLRNKKDKREERQKTIERLTRPGEWGKEKRSEGLNCRLPKRHRWSKKTFTENQYEPWGGTRIGSS